MTTPIRDNPFKVGEIPPRVWVHFEFDFADTMKYIGNCVVSSNEEAARLYNKYVLPSQGKEGSDVM